MKRRELQAGKPGNFFAPLSVASSDWSCEDASVHHKRAISSFALSTSTLSTPTVGPEEHDEFTNRPHVGLAAPHAAQSFADRRFLGGVGRLDARRDGLVHLRARVDAGFDRTAAALGLCGD